MDPDLNRRTFLGGAALSGLALVLPGGAGASDTPTGAGPAGPGGIAGHFPHQDPELVRRVVGASHGDIDTVAELVEKRPELAKAQWDWGFGDWESALGAASHTGRREIAELLLAHGARPTLFSATMLGQLTVVRAFVEAVPGCQAIPGPHGIPLLAHARAGGEPAAAVAEYLERVGGAERPAPVPLDDAARERYLGSYAFGTGALDRLEVTVGPFGLMIGRPEGTARGLSHLGDHAFHPAGAPSVRVRFEVPADAEEPASGVTIHDAELIVRAVRR
jgi:hypothetical protein